jgi:hypothetical protein
LDGAGPESITTIRGYGFSDVQLQIIARRFASSRNDGVQGLLVGEKNIQSSGRIHGPHSIATKKWKPSISRTGLGMRQAVAYLLPSEPFCSSEKLNQ